MEDKIIYLSKIKTLAFLLFGLLFLIVGFLTYNLIPQGFEDKKIYIAPIGMLAIGTLFTIFFTIKLFDTRPKLIINEQGITIVEKQLLIYWKDISDFFIVESWKKGDSRGAAIFIEVHNPEEYLQKITNPLVNKALSFAQNFVGSPLSIDTTNLQISRQKLLVLLNDYLDTYRAKHSTIV